MRDREEPHARVADRELLTDLDLDNLQLGDIRIFFLPTLDHDARCAARVNRRIAEAR